MSPSGTAYYRMQLLRTSKEFIQPKEYLDFAKKDLEDKGLRGMVNALGNIKRAIDSQLDINLEKYGLLKISESRRWSYPKKIQVMNKLGLISPNILKKINNMRISVEHYHKKPQEKDVEDCLDIAELFLEIFKHETTRTEFLIDYSNDVAVLMDVDKGEITVYNNTKELYEFGGIQMFHEVIIDKKIKPKIIVNNKDVDGWINICKKYLVR